MRLMELETRQCLANTARERWERQYSRYGVTHWSHSVTEKLRQLGKNPPPDEVDKAIGNSSWTTSRKCDECGEKSSMIVMLGEKPDYESNTARICRSCLEKALQLFDMEAAQ